MENQKLTLQQALEQGYTHFFYKGEGYQAMNELSQVTDEDFKRGLELVNKETETISSYVTAEDIREFIAETSEENANLIYDFGLNLGLAFQLQDDYLDAFGDPATFGKQVGGDIIENKKTYLYLKAIEFASSEERNQLLQLFSVSLEDNSSKIEEVKTLFNATGASKATQQAIQDYTLKAFATLDKMNISSDKKAMLKAFGENLMNRNV